MGKMDLRCIQFDIGSDQDGARESDAEGSYAATQSGDEEVQCKGIDYMEEDVAESTDGEEEQEKKEVYESGEEESAMSSDEEKARSKTPEEKAKQRAVAGTLKLECVNVTSFEKQMEVLIRSEAMVIFFQEH